MPHLWDAPGESQRPERALRLVSSRRAAGDGDGQPGDLGRALETEGGAMYRAGIDGEVIEEQPMATSDPDGEAVWFLLRVLVGVAALAGLLLWAMVG